MVNIGLRRSKRIANCHRNNFASLPPEMLLKIFSNLSIKALGKVARVSSRWNRIATETSLWRRHSVKINNKYLEPGHLGIMLSRGISRLEMSGICFTQGAFFRDAAPPGGYRLQSLSVGMFLIKFDLLTLLSRCNNLKELQIRRPSMSASIFREIRRFTQLQKLDITTYLGGTFDYLLAIVRACPRLTRWRSSILSLDAPPMNHTEVTAFVQAIPETMEDFSFYTDLSRSIHDDHIGLLANCCPNINHLDLTRCTNLTAASIEHICSFPKLETLVVRGCENIPYYALRYLQSVSSLRSMDVGVFFNVEALFALQEALPNVVVSGEYESADIVQQDIDDVM